MRKFIHILIIGLLAVCLVNNPLIEPYVSVLKSESIQVASKKNALYEEISAKASEYSIPAEDAKIDPVWKAVPGYNGIKVDIDASFKKMKSDGKFNEENLVF